MCRLASIERACNGTDFETCQRVEKEGLLGEIDGAAVKEISMYVVRQTLDRVIE